MVEIISKGPELNVRKDLNFKEFKAKLTALGEQLDGRVYNIGMSFLLAGGSVGMMIPAMPLLVAQLQIPSSQFGMVIAAFGASKLLGNQKRSYLLAPLWHSQCKRNLSQHLPRRGILGSSHYTTMCKHVEHKNVPDKYGKF